MSDDLFIALRAYVLALLPTIEVVQGLGNGVPMPSGEFVCITGAGQRRLRTNQESYAPVTLQRSVEMGTEYRIQIDCYGPNSSDHATTLVAMWRDPYACAILAPHGCQPLDATDPQQSALINGEENYEQRWMFAAMLQFNPVITVAQEFAEVLDLGLVSVDTIPTT